MCTGLRVSEAAACRSMKTKDQTEPNKREKNPWQHKAPTMSSLLGYGLSLAGILARDCAADGINPNVQPGFVIASDEPRLHLILRNVERCRIRQHPLQTIADLDNHLAILEEHKEYHAIAAFLLTHAPRLCHTLRVVRDLRIALHFGKNRDHDLV